MRNFFILGLLCLSTMGYAQVQLNEVSAANLESYLDNYQKSEDWIELYNTSNADVNLSGWYLSDKEDNPTKWKIPNATIIPANGFFTFWCSGRDEVSAGNYHTNFKLTQTKGNEYAVLANPAGDIVDSYFITSTLVEQSNCRSTDGIGDWMVCSDPSFGTTNNSTPQYAGYTAIPSMSLAAGFYDTLQHVVLTNNDPNSILRYTLDGTNPTENSPEYTDTLIISQTTVVKAQAFSTDPTILTGKMDFNTYFIDEDFSLAVFSVAADEVQDLANGNGPLIPIGSIEYFGTDGTLEAKSFGSLNRHGQDSWVLNQRSLDWVSRDEMGYSKAVEAQLFEYTERDEYQKFMFRASGDDNYPAINDGQHEFSCHIRDEYVQLLSHLGDMKLDLRAVERCVVFLNGDYWGVYGLRNRPVDHDYTDYFYDQGKYDIQYLSTWGDTEIEYGGQDALTDWLDFRDFILTNDMSDPDNYQIVKDNMQVKSLCDYMIANLNTVASDWLNYNTGWWRGLNPDGDHKKWGYILWDNDATFDYYINYSGVPNISPNAEPCDIDEISDFMDDFFNNGGGGGGGPVFADPTNCLTVTSGSCPYPPTDSVLMQVVAQDAYCCDSDWDGVCQDLYNAISANPGGGGGGGNLGGGDVGRHEKIFLKLQEENEEFRQFYYSRQADLQNTVYSCENMLTKFDSMVAVIAPEMPRQIARWGGSMSEWESNLQRMRTFIENRCTLLDDGMTDCFDLTGPYELTLMTYPLGSGRIKVNTIDPESFPWTGAYFGGMENLLDAKEFNGGLDFHHWESTSGATVITDPFSKDISIELTQNDTLIAFFGNQVSAFTPNQAEYGLFAAPNPSKGFVNIRYQLPTDISAHQVALMDVHGRKVWENNAEQNSGGTQIHSLDLEALGCVPGLYLIQVQTKHGVQVAKVSYQR